MRISEMGIGRLAKDQYSIGEGVYLSPIFFLYSLKSVNEIRLKSDMNINKLKFIKLCGRKYGNLLKITNLRYQSY